MKVDERANETTSRASTGPEPRRPYWMVGLALLGLVVVALVAAFVLDRQLRPSVGIEPTSPTATGVTPSISAGAERQATAPQAVPTTAAPVAAPRATASTPGSTGLSTPNSALEREVEQAYLRYWDFYSEALLSLDTSRIAEVAADDERRRIEEEVDGFRNRKHAVRVKVTHKYVIFDVTEGDAKVHDEILNRSFTVDPITKEPPQGPDEADLEKDLYFLKKIDGTWKVVKSVRQEG